MMEGSLNPDAIVHDEPNRGRRAQHPGQIPARGWFDVLWRVKDQLDADNVSIVAGGLALYALLAIFPTLAAAVAIYGLFASPEQITAQVQSFAGFMPDAGLRILDQQLRDLTQHRGSLSFGLIGSILVALWSARKGMTALMTAMNVAYNEHDRRSFLRRLAVSSAFTLGSVLGFIIVVVLGVAVPIILGFLPLGIATEWILLIARWLLLWIVVVLGLTLVYRFAPHRATAQWRWVNWGAGIAATLWLLSGVAFAIYVRNFSSYSKAYGAVGGVVITLMWFYISSYVVLLGAEINSELERQTVKDSTEGEPKPLGERGAFSADTVGPARASARSS